MWPEKSQYAIEEYIFARFYMYSNVYQHKTTRGFEKLVHAAWKRAKQLLSDGRDAYLIHEIAEFLSTEMPSVDQYLAMDDSTLLYQLRVWTRHPDSVLSDLATRFLTRNRFAAVEDPVGESALGDARSKWESALKGVVEKAGFDAEFYALRDDLKLTIYNPYIPEKETREQDPYNAIFIQPEKPGAKPKEISQGLERLAPVTGIREKHYRYYVPRECVDAVRSLADSREW